MNNPIISKTFLTKFVTFSSEKFNRNSGEKCNLLFSTQFSFSKRSWHEIKFHLTLSVNFV